MKCSCPTCTNEAKWVPVLLIYLPAQYQVNTPIHCELSIYKCEECKDSFELVSVLNDDTWERFSAEIAASRGAAPDRQRTQLAWVSIARSNMVKYHEAQQRKQLV